MPLCSNRDIAAEPAGDLQEGAEGRERGLRPRALVRMVGGLMRLEDRWQAETEDLRADFEREIFREGDR
jgi:hypothetical protein